MSPITRRRLAAVMAALVTTLGLGGRPAVAASPPPPPPLQVAGPGVLLIARDLQGQTLWVDRPVDNLARLGFNDSASHIEVHGGPWQLCDDAGFGGRCLVFAPGRHELPPALRNRLSSLRPAASGWPPGRPGDEERGDLVLYEHADFSGRQLGLDRAERNLADRGFNDRASAVVVRRGRWELCRHADFGGECRVYGPGSHRLDGGLNDAVSSVRPLGGGGAGGVTLVDSAGRRADEVRVDEAVANLRDLGFNDRADAVIVHGGRWELCTDARWRGQCVTLGPGRHRLPPALAGQVSSLRPR